MSKRFTRNIIKTSLNEPLDTNRELDLISVDSEAYVRIDNEYKKITGGESENVKGTDVKSVSEYIDVKKSSGSKNEIFTLSTEHLDIVLKQIMLMLEGNNYLGKYEGDFIPVKGNNETLRVEASPIDGFTDNRSMEFDIGTGHLNGIVNSLASEKLVIALKFKDMEKKAKKNYTINILNTSDKDLYVYFSLLRPYSTLERAYNDREIIIRKKTSKNIEMTTYTDEQGKVERVYWELKAY